LGEATALATDNDAVPPPLASMSSTRRVWSCHFQGQGCSDPEFSFDKDGAYQM
jgi:hypothetical protein